MSIGLGGIVILALVVAVITIGVKVKHNTEKIQELDELFTK
ncbi:Mad15 [Candidatus Magnetomoraceae bacterium gMMP-15]